MLESRFMRIPHRHYKVVLQSEFSYPAIIASQNTIHIVYTWKRINIRYCQFTLQDFDTNSESGTNSANSESDTKKKEK